MYICHLKYNNFNLKLWNFCIEKNISVIIKMISKCSYRGPVTPQYKFHKLTLGHNLLSITFPKVMQQP